MISVQVKTGIAVHLRIFVYPKASSCHDQTDQSECQTSPLPACYSIDARRITHAAAIPRKRQRLYHPSGGATCQTTLAGLPETTVRSGTLIFTTERAATMAPRPMVTPFMIIESLPIQA